MPGGMYWPQLLGLNRLTRHGSHYFLKMLHKMLMVSYNLRIHGAFRKDKIKIKFYIIIQAFKKLLITFKVIYIKHIVLVGFYEIFQ